MYLTVELARQEQVRAANQAARRSGLPVVDGEVIWEEPEEAEGPWHQGGYAYHHVLARVQAPPPNANA